jgi:mono/diheme cytochrome c family protein
MTSLTRAAAAAALFFMACASAAAQEPVERGRTIVEEKCARCHATGPAGESPLAAAPLFRTLSERYPLGDLEEALAEGIVTGHPDMPAFVFEPEEIAAILAYLESIQAR